MTVRELIEQLKQFPEHLVVVYHTQEDTVEPVPVVKIYEFDSSYWTPNGFVTLPKDVEFVSL
jgi:hypothetical protein